MPLRIFFRDGYKLDPTKLHPHFCMLCLDYELRPMNASKVLHNFGNIVWNEWE